MNANSTLNLEPAGRTAITFSTSSVDAATSGYYAPADYLELNEAKRDEIFYSGGTGIDGGEYISHHGPLVEVTFRVFVWGDTKAQCILRAQALNEAVNNNGGGTLEYKPEGITTRSTYYTYVKSLIPGLAGVQDNKWDNPNVSAPSSEPYILAFDVTLQTMPLGTSDPDNLVSLTLSRTTIKNTRDGADYNYFDIDGDDIKGDKPASIRLMLRNGQGKMHTVYVTARSALLSTLANLQQVYEAEDASVISPSTAWSSIVDAFRSAGDYRRCNPGVGANGVAQGIRFAISNAGDHMGRVAILAICKTGSPESWSVQAKYRLTDDEVFAAESYDVPQYGIWHTAYCGELDLPPVPVSNTETITPYIDLYFTRSAGDTGDYIDVDYILLLFTNETLMQFTVDVGYDSGQKLLSEGTPENRSIAHIIDQSSHVLENVVDRHYGNKCLEAIRGFDTRVALLFQRGSSISDGGAANALLDENFDSYEALYWRPVADMETDETWVHTATGETGGADTTFNVEGDQGERATWTSGEGIWCYSALSPSIDLDEDRFTDDDFVCFAIYLTSGAITDIGNNDIKLVFVSGTDSFQATIHNGGGAPVLVAGYNFVVVKKSDIATVGSPAWSKIDRLIVILTDSVGADSFYFDAWCIAKADPGDATVPNPTGAEWAFQPIGYHWGIANNSPAGSSGAVLACYNQEAGIEKAAVYDTFTPNDARGFLKVAANKDAGEAGVVFRSNVITLGSEDLYAFVVDWDNDQLEALEYLAGVKSSLATAVPQSVTNDTWYWLGFFLVGGSIRLYFSATEPVGSTQSEKLRDLLSTSNRVFDVFDLTQADGKTGVMSTGCLSMFDELYVESLSGLSLPSDYVIAAAEALFKTSYPFAD